ncbi:hypothetical protein [Haloarchaeobius sp. TZWWS8]|uniref:hypothetical protein n=1 Tax=Haloarchaeobius sp. TZWWS8 TaxID=3446121 RepID=UPI003EBA939C
METTAVQEYVDHARAVVTSSDSLGVRNTQLRLVEPLLDALGWNVRSSDVEADHQVTAGETVDYALNVGGTPAVFVESRPLEDDLTAADAETVAERMRLGGVSWAMLTNGRQFAFFAIRAGRVDRHSCRLEDLPRETAALERFSHEAARGRFAGRARAVNRIDAARDGLHRSILDELLDVTDGEAESVLDAATSQLLDDLVTTLSTAERATTESEIDEASAERMKVDEPAVERPETDETEATEPTRNRTSRNRTSRNRTGPEHAGAAGVQTVAEAAATEADEDGEYVVRFFDDRASVGAVGSSTPAGAMGQVVDYLVDQYALAAGLSLPYCPGDDSYAVLNRRPVHPNGEPMRPAVELDAGPFLWTGGSMAERRDRLEHLASRAGLRCMFQGDWAP